MSATIQNPTKVDLDILGIKNTGIVYWNPSTPELYEHIIRRREGYLLHRGPVVLRTGHHTGRSPNDKFIVKESSSKENIWWGDVNRPFSAEQFDHLYHKLTSYLQNRDLFVQDCLAGADERYALPIRVITERAWHSLFARNMFIRKPRETLIDHVPEFTVIDAPNFHSDPEIDGTNSEVFVIIHFDKKLVIIGGTSYAGEIKKSVFSVMNYLLPLKGVLSMHCSANYKTKNDTAIFFGLSGTGKTTLSADSSRTLIGDDEHGWSNHGVFNFEGGCYAKVIRLSPEAEPEIYETTRTFGTLLENVAFDQTSRRIDLNDDSLTENTRASYAISQIPNADPTGCAGQPKHIVMLTADAFGVLPPIAKLTPEQAMYHFLSGYTAKVAGTEKGITEPQATFSACFGAPFMPLHPSKYAELLGEKIQEQQVSCWLVNTGWTGGPYGVGKRMEIKYTRRLVNAALDGELNDIPTVQDPIFGLHIPTHCDGVPDSVLNPVNTWEDKEAFERKARDLAHRFHVNFKKFEDVASKAICSAGPLVG